MFSEELAELDRNTARYMVDVMSEEIKNKDDIIANQSEEIKNKELEIEELQRKVELLNQRLESE